MNLRSYFWKLLGNAYSIACEIFLVWTQIHHLKTALHLTAGDFQTIFDAVYEVILTYCKDDKSKSVEKRRRQAVCAQIPHA